MKMLYTKVSTKAALKTQYNRKEIARNIIWFNPPFSQTNKTHFEKSFFRLLDKHFPESQVSKVHNDIYKCAVSATQTFKQRVYLGIAEGNWKQRLYNHRQSFKDKKHKNKTA